MRRIITAAMGFAVLAATPLTVEAAGSVNVTFVNPERYGDIGDRYAGRRSGVLHEVESYLESLGERHLKDGQILSVEVLNIDLAGQNEPWRFELHGVRIMRGVTPPGSGYAYALIDRGTLLVRAEENVTDITYFAGPAQPMATDASATRRRCCATGSAGASCASISRADNSFLASNGGRSAYSLLAHKILEFRHLLHAAGLVAGSRHLAGFGHQRRHLIGILSGGSARHLFLVRRDGLHLIGSSSGIGGSSRRLRARSLGVLQNLFLMLRRGAGLAGGCARLGGDGRLLEHREFLPAIGEGRRREHYR
jgi:hypothetical protein